MQRLAPLPAEGETVAGEEDPKAKVFEGFSGPAFTQTPNVLFDELMPTLGEAELKVLLYIVRRTWGFAGKQMGDAISLNQLCNGITTADGVRLDYGTGLSRSGVTKALVALRKRGIIVRIKNRDQIRGDMPTTYRLRMLGDPLDEGDEPLDISDITPIDPVSTTVDPPVHERGLPPSTTENSRIHGETLPLSTGVDPQNKVLQQKESGKTVRNVESSTGQSTKSSLVQARVALTDYAVDFAREFNDEAKLSSTLTRMVNLYQASGMDIDDFIDLLITARARTKERSAAIAKQASSGIAGRKNRMPYFFSIVENLIDEEKESQQAG